eukprot:13330680-Ditylum_brightwellii.AAC.1
MSSPDNVSGMNPGSSKWELFSSECRVAVYAIHRNKGLLKYRGDVTVPTRTGYPVGTSPFWSERTCSDQIGHDDDITVPAGT